MGANTSRPQTPRLFSPRFRISSRRRSSLMSQSPLAASPSLKSPRPPAPKLPSIKGNSNEEEDGDQNDIAIQPPVKLPPRSWFDLSLADRTESLTHMTTTTIIDREHVVESSIPAEIIHLVLSYLDIRSLGTIQMLGRFWYNMADDEGLWRAAVKVKTAGWSYSNLPPLSFLVAESASHWKHLYVTYLYKMDRICTACRLRFNLMDNTRDACHTHTGTRQFITRIGLPSGMLWSCCMKSDFSDECNARPHVGKIGAAPPVLCRAVAMFQFDTEDDMELSVIEGEIISVLEKDENGWWLSRNRNGLQGYVPSAYLRELERQ